jgi:membrane protein implicated in regulation of membrane protease activity
MYTKVTYYFNTLTKEVAQMGTIDNTTMYWLAAMIILILIEIPTVGLTTIWFAIGALVAVIASVIGLGFACQVVVFIAVSIVMLVFTRPWAMKYINANRTKTNYEGIIGKVVRITQDVDNISETGCCLVNGQEWTVRAVDENVKIPSGKLAKVVDIRGVKLIVEEVKEEKL